MDVKGPDRDVEESYRKVGVRQGRDFLASVSETIINFLRTMG